MVLSNIPSGSTDLEQVIADLTTQHNGHYYTRIFACATQKFTVLFLVKLCVLIDIKSLFLSNYCNAKKSYFEAKLENFIMKGKSAFF